MAVLITNRQNLYKISTDRIRTTAQALLSALDKAEAELSLLITEDEEIAKINEVYLSRSGPTNVIAFPMQTGDFPDVGPRLLGDVVISVETAAREAAEAGAASGERFTELLIHGILHLLGYEHESNEADAEEMFSKTDELKDHLKRIGPGIDLIESDDA